MPSPMMRATTSLGPPAGNGTIIVIGRSGYGVCAAGDMPTMNAAATAAVPIIAIATTGVVPYRPKLNI